MTDKLYKDLTRYSKYKVFNKQDAEDILHDSLVTALEKGAKTHTFFRRTFDYTVRSSYRDKYYEQKMLSEYKDTLNTVNVYSSSGVETFVKVDANKGSSMDYLKCSRTLEQYCLKTFRPKVAQAFIQGYIYGYPSDQVAASIGSTPKSVRQMISYAKKLVARSPACRQALSILEDLYNDARQ